jgi:hypothetical protein
MIVQTIYGHPLLVETECDLSGPLPVVENGHLYTRQPTLKLRLIAKAKQSAIVFYTWYLYQTVFAPEKMEKGLGTDLYREPPADTVDAGELLNPYREYIDFVRNTVGEDVKIAFLYIPYSYVIHPEDRARYSHGQTIAPGELRRLSAEIESLLAENSITYIDPTAALVDKSASERMYYFLDVHFTPAGNKVLADRAIPALQQLVNQ